MRAAATTAAIAVAFVGTKVARCAVVTLPWPTHAVLTPVQQKVFDANAARAAAASPAGTALALQMLDSGLFRDLWHERCPALANLPGTELLRRYRAALEVTEVVHGFPAADNPHQNNALDMSIDMMMNSNATYFFNQWQMPLLYPQREFLSYFSLVAYLAPAGAAEPAIWGFPPFSGVAAGIGRVLGSGFPASLAEADNRIVYTVLNQARVDFPAYLWGDVAVVFNNSYIRNSTLLEPTDTGDYVCACNRSFTASFCRQWNQTSCKEFWYCNWAAESEVCEGGERGAAYEHNCSAWPGAPSGTWNHVDHLLSPYAYWYNQSDAAALDRVATLLGRMLGRSCVLNVSAARFDYYFEAELFGRLEFPTAVRFVVADMGPLFGTALGATVRQWCTRWGWPLLWSPGVYAHPEPPSYPPRNFTSNRRILDPAALLQSRAGGNLSRAGITAAVGVFERWWAVAEAVRANASAPTTAEVTGWWEGLAAAAGGLRIEPLYAGDCATPDDCIGRLTASSDCICYNPQ